ncbi:MAG: VapC toxin family PIN domain ribonuclease [Ideonella sp. MAG2]|nr:MAG: VapC toxin family PIN domain ribonuclease [Ideonella sp. MAG2]
MILVDSSVWIDFFRGQATVQAEWLDRNLGVEGLLVGDLILAEVLRGFKDDRGFNEARRMLGRLQQVPLCGEELAVEAARNYRLLRAKGVTVRGTIDVIIATRCLLDDLVLLHSDRDFDPFETHLGLRCVDCAT